MNLSVTQRVCFAYLLLLGSAFSFASNPAVESSELQFYTHSVRNAVVENDDGELVGVENGGRRALDVEIVRWIMNDLGIANNMQVVPFRRGLREVQTEDNIVLFNVLKTEERQRTMQWVGPLDSYRSFFYESVERPTGITSLEDAKNVDRICVLSGNVQHSHLLKMGFDNLVLANSYAQCAKLLLHGRVSLLPASENLLSLNYDGFERLRRTGIVIYKNEGYLGLSANIPKAVVEQMQASLDKLKGSEDYQRLRLEYSN
jgi:polar amino acid transport system substrate-binding protein